MNPQITDRIAASIIYIAVTPRFMQLTMRFLISSTEFCFPGRQSQKASARQLIMREINITCSKDLIIKSTKLERNPYFDLKILQQRRRKLELGPNRYRVFWSKFWSGPVGFFLNQFEATYHPCLRRAYVAKPSNHHFLSYWCYNQTHC